MDLALYGVPTMTDHIEQKLAQVKEVIFERIEALPVAIEWSWPTQEDY
jgi:hypothetical protein